MIRIPAKIIILLVCLIACSCTKTIYRDSSDIWANDLLHGDVVGTVVQEQSNAPVYVSQLEVIDSTIVDPNTGNFGFYDLRAGNYDLSIRADGYRTYIHRNVRVTGGSVTYLGEIDLSTVPDLVSEHYPADMDEVVYANQWQRLNISILFSGEMDRESVEAAFSTDPPTDGIFLWGKYTEAPAPRYYLSDEMAARGFSYDVGATITTYSKISSLSFQLAQKDSYTDTTYHVTLGTSAMDTSGNQLRFPLEFSFRTIQSAVSYNGILTNPFDGDVAVPPTTNSIEVTFPKRMDPATTEAAISNNLGDLFYYVWPSKNILRIYSGEPLLADTTYEFTIDGTATDLDGLVLGDDFIFSFRTGPVMITRTRPMNAEVYVHLGTPITMWFNTFVIKSSVEAAFSISPTVAGNLRWGTEYSSTVKEAITFWPSSALSMNTKYTITVNTSARDLHGTNIAEPFSFTFITLPEL